MIQLFTFVMDGQMMYSFRHQIKTDLIEKYGEEKERTKIKKRRNIVQTVIIFNY